MECGVVVHVLKRAGHPYAQEACLRDADRSDILEMRTERLRTHELHDEIRARCLRAPTEEPHKVRMREAHPDRHLALEPFDGPVISNAVWPDDLDRGLTEQLAIPRVVRLVARTFAELR